MLAAVLASLSIQACGGESGSQEGADTHTTADPHTTASGPPEASVTVTGRVRQRITGWGASVVSDTPNDPLVVPNLPERALRRLERLVFVKARVNLVRVFGPGYGTERQTGDLRPRRDDPRYAFMRRARRYGVRFMLTAADAPAELKTESDLHGESLVAGGGSLAAGAEGEYARYLIGLLEFARDEVGVPFDYIAVGNEPDNGFSPLTMLPAQAALVHELLAERLQAARLRTGLVLGDTTTWQATLGYAEAALARPGVASATAAIASHSYGGGPEDVRAVADLARTSGIPVWQTEWGSGCVDCPDDPSMDLALRWSEQIATALVDGEASAWFAFRAVAASDHGPGDALIVRTSSTEEPFYTTKRFDVFRQYSTVATPGSRRLETRVSGTGILAVAFRSPGRVALVLTNPTPEDAPVALDLGRRGGRLSGVRTDPELSFRPLPEAGYAGRPMQLSLPARSVTSLTLRPRTPASRGR